MKLTLASVIPAAQDEVFAALVDPEILQRVIPGCDALTETGSDQYTATLKIGAAGLKGTYTGKAAVRDKVPPNSLSLHFEGKGAPGFVRGAAAITLLADPHGTRVSCDVDFVIGGLVAAVGSRLIEATARKLSEVFFGQLARELVIPSKPQDV